MNGTQERAAGPRAEASPCPICMRPAQLLPHGKGGGVDVACPHCSDFAVSADAFQVIDRTDFPDLARSELVHLSRSAAAEGARLLINRDILQKAYARAESEWNFTEEIVAIKCENRSCVSRSEESFTVEGQARHLCAVHYHEFMSVLVKGRIEAILKALHGEAIPAGEVADFVARNQAELRRFFRKVGAEV